MKKLAVIAVFLAAAGSGFVHAREIDRRHSFQVNAPMLIGDIIMGASDNQDDYSYALDVEFQYAASRHWNIVFRPGFLIARSVPFQYDDNGEPIDCGTDSRTIAVNLMPGFLFRPFGRGLRGLYIGLYPNIGWENIRKAQENPEIDDHFLLAGAGLEAGYEWIFRSGFSTTIGGGLERNWRFGLNEIKGEYAEPDRLWDLRFIILMGYSF